MPENEQVALLRFAINADFSHYRIFRDVCRSARASGNLVQDAWFAALAIESGCEWITTDRDYARFEGLRWREPYQV
jgi:predicted nucleic acid-binding protein